MQFTKMENGDLLVSEILPTIETTMQVYKCCGGTGYTFSAPSIGIKYHHIKAESDTEACKKIAEIIEESLDNLYELLSARKNSKKVFVKIFEKEDVLQKV